MIKIVQVSERTDQYVEILDGSRVHPETYEWARKMAVDALEFDDSGDPTAALEEILQVVLFSCNSRYPIVSFV